jgi:hypothetical protein
VDISPCFIRAHGRTDPEAATEIQPSTRQDKRIMVSAGAVIALAQPSGRRWVYADLHGRYWLSSCRCGTAMRIPLSVLVVFGISAHAHAEPPVRATPLPPTLATSEAVPPRFAFGLSSPVGWAFGSFGASGYVRIDRHVAVRANIATRGGGGLFGYFIEDSPGGMITDYGISAVWYPRRAWDGFLIEAGALLRARNTYVTGFEADARVTTRSTRYAGHALIGWSWGFASCMFVAVAAGGSWGRESGKATSVDGGSGGDTMTSPVRRKQLDGEGYLRFGVAFGS